MSNEIKTDAELAARMRDADRCPATQTAHGWRISRTYRCQRERGHDGQCSYRRAGGQGGSIFYWWGANTEPSCEHPATKAVCTACGEDVP